MLNHFTPLRRALSGHGTHLLLPGDVMPSLKTMVRFGVWLLPPSLAKNTLLRTLGHEVHPSATARANLVWNVTEFRLGAGSRIGRFNIVKNLRRVDVGEGASIGRLNVISSHPVFMRLYKSGAKLIMGSESYITSHHRLDCAGGVTLGKLAALAGHQSKVMTHSVDIALNAQSAYPADIGQRTFVGARSLILGGARIPERSVLAAGAVVGRSRDDDPGASGLWAGVPATFKKPLDGDWFDRDARSTDRVFIPETGEMIDDAL